VIEFFWGKCQEAGNPHGYTREDFSYPGLRPQTRETGILMIVDAVEAASRTVQPPTREKFRNVVEHIVLSKLTQGQLDDSDLSLEDIHKIVDNLVDSLVHGRHERVKYPWQKGEATAPGPAAEGAPPAPAAPAAPAPAAAAPAAEPPKPARPAEPLAPAANGPAAAPAAPPAPAPPPVAAPATARPVPPSAGAATRPLLPVVPPPAAPPVAAPAPAPTPAAPPGPKPSEPPDQAGGI
jgi:hypothetical protein